MKPTELLPMTCKGVTCMQSGCGNQAAHKVGEQNIWHDKYEAERYQEFQQRHELTTYLCEEHFQTLMKRDPRTAPPPQAVAEINTTPDDQSSSEAGYIKDMNTKELLADAALEWARLILYLQREYAAGKAEFRIAFQSKSWFIVHPLSKDGQTINVNLNESEDDAIEKHLQEWKRLKDEYTKSKAQAGAETVSSGSDKQMAETTTADSGGEVHVTSGAEDAEVRVSVVKSFAGKSVQLTIGRSSFYLSVRDPDLAEYQKEGLESALNRYARHIAAKAVEDSKKQLVSHWQPAEVEPPISYDGGNYDDAFTAGYERAIWNICTWLNPQIETT